MIGRRESHALSYTPLLMLGLIIIFTAASCKDVKQEKVYPRGCYYADQCSVEDFEIPQGEAPTFDESKCGTVTLEESITPAESEDLQPLAGITHLKGNLRIVESNLTNVSGLENLLCIDGNLEIAANTSLANLDGLASLEQVSGFIKVGTKEEGTNSALLNINGLGNVHHVGTHLWLTKNPLITNIDALGQITTADNIVITGNDALENIDGLAGLTEVRGYLTIGQKNENNSSLRNLDGLSSVTHVGDFVWIAYNDVLQNLDGLTNVEWIGDYLGVFGNNSLASVAGLHGLNTLCGFLNIAENPKLPGCEAAKIPLETELNCSVCIRLNQADTCPDQDDGCLYDRCVQLETCDGGAQ